MKKCAETILFIDDTPVWGGGPKVLADYLTSLAAYQRIVIRPMDAQESPGMLPCEKRYSVPFPTYPARLSNPLVQFVMLPAVIRAALHCRRVIKTHRPDLVVANTFYSLVPLWLIKPSLPPVVYVQHTVDTPANAAAGRLFSICNRIVAVSHACRNHLPPNIREKVTVIPNAVDFPTDRNPPAPLREKLGWQQNLVIGYCGRFAPVKNLPALVEAFALILKTRPDARLLLVGDGPDRPSIEQRINQLGLGHVVHLADFSERPLDAMAVFDLFVLPSLSEGCSLSLLEAFALGIPVVGTPCPGITEVMQDGVTGILAAGYQAEAIADAIRRMIPRLPATDFTINAMQQLGRCHSRSGQAQAISALIASILLRPHERQTRNGEDKP